MRTWLVAAILGGFAAGGLLAEAKAGGSASPLLRAAEQLADQPGGLAMVRQWAWLLATHDDPRVRDGQAAVALAQWVLRHESRPGRLTLEVLAAAHAETGDLRRAADWSAKAAASAGPGGLLEGRKLPLRQSPALPFRPDQSAAARAQADAYLCHLVARWQFDQGNAALARQCWEWAVEISPEYLPARYCLARELLAQGDLPAAEEHLQAVLEKSPSAADAWNLLGLVRQAQSEPAEAAACFRRGVAEQPGWLPAVSNLAWLLATHPDPAVRNPHEATALIDSLPDEAAALRANLRQALAAVERTSQRPADELPMRNPAPPDAGETFDRDLHLGRQFVELGQGNQAFPHLQRAVAARPDHAEALNLLGMALVQQGRLVEGAIQFARALQTQPALTQAASNLALVLAAHEDEALRQPDEAVFYGQLALDHAPRRAWRTLDVLGMAHAAEGDFRRAAELADHAVAMAEAAGRVEDVHLIQQRAAAYRRQLAYRLGSSVRHHPAEVLATRDAELGLLALQQARWEVARRHLERAVEKMPNQPRWHHRLALACVQCGEADRAIGHWRKAVNLAPDWPTAVGNLAWMLAARGDSPASCREAVALARRACQQTDHRHAGLLDTLAVACAAAGDRDQAAAALRRAIAAARQSGDAAQQARLQQRLEALRAGEPLTVELADRRPADAAYLAMHRRLGLAALRAGRHAEAHRHLDRAMQISPADPATRHALAVSLVRLGRDHEALAEYESLLALEPEYFPAANNLAWLLATHPSAEIRHPQRAVALAERLCAAQYPPPAALDTLAAAYAAAGRYAEAAQAAEAAVERFQALGDAQRANSAAGRLREYQSRQ